MKERRPYNDNDPVKDRLVIAAIIVAVMAIAYGINQLIKWLHL
jgi:preprotein translocase subunit SecE